MKHILKNSVLVFMLFGLFMLPLLGLSFIQYDDSSESTPVVLGARTVKVVDTEKAKPAVKVSENALVVLDSADNSANINAAGLEVVDQVEVELNLSSEPVQKFYSVLAGQYPRDEYEVILVVSDEVRKEGVNALLVNDSEYADLIVSVPSGYEDSSVLVTLLVVK